MSRPYVRVVIVAALVLLAALALPAVATAAPAAAKVAPQMVKPDIYEPDDTTATAKAFPSEMSGESIHTFTNTYDASGNLVPDTDMFKFTVVETGTPVVIEANQVSGYFACMMTAYETDASGALLPRQPSMGVWGLTIGNTMLFRAPHPGTFYVGIKPAIFGNGVYELHVSVGIARRISGRDRYETAAQVSKLMWPNAGNPLGNLIGQVEDTSALGPAGCVIARGDDFADALAGAAFAGRSETGRPLNGALAMPVLLARTQGLDFVTWMEVQRLAQMRKYMTQPFTVYVLGNGIGETLDFQLTMLDYIDFTGVPFLDPTGNPDLVETLRIVHVAGRNRFDTAAKLAAIEASSNLGVGDTAFLVNGYGFADALSAAPVASWARGPVLMTKQASLPSETKAFLTAHPEITRVVVAGSPSSVATAVLDELEAAPLSRTAERWAGANRYETSEIFAKHGVTDYHMNPGTFMVASGKSFADGLSAAPLTAFNGGPLLLTKPEVLSPAVVDYYSQPGPGTMLPVYVIGGTSAVGNAAFGQLNDLWISN